MLITFEGGEGCGKSTHSKKLKKYLEENGHVVLLTREPGGSALGKFLRQMLLRSKRSHGKFTELFLFAADRSEHVDSVILPALMAGKIVICDRYVDSTTAYQSGGRKLSAKLVASINKASSMGIEPDLTLLLDIDPKEGIRRGTLFTGKDNFESENIEFHKRVRKTYLELAKKHPKRIKIVDTSRSMKNVQLNIRKLVNEKL